MKKQIGNKSVEELKTENREEEKNEQKLIGISPNMENQFQNKTFEELKNDNLTNELMVEAMNQKDSENSYI